MTQRRTFRDLIAANRRNSAMLVVAFVLVVGVVSAVMMTALLDGGPGEAVLLGLVGTGGAGVAAMWSYFLGDRAILAASQAAPLKHADDPQLYNVVEEMAIAAGIPVPTVYLIPDTALNAFATGRDPQHAAVAITQGLRDRLSRDELQAVIAHEISHVRNYDIRLAMLLATLVGITLMITDSFWRTLRWRSWGRSRGSSRRDGGAGALLMIVALVVGLVAPLLARIIQLAASREREYLADAGAVELTRNPEAMIGALRKLGEDREVLEAANRATAHLYIVQPIRSWERRADGLLATHPPLEERIRRLQQLLPGGGVPTREGG